MFAAKGKSSPEASNKSEHELKPLLLVGEDETSNYRKSRQEEDDKKLVNDARTTSHLPGPDKTLVTTDEPPSKPNRNRLPAVDSEDVTRNPSDVNDQFDETDGVLSADVDSDCDEPVYPFDEPKDFDNTVVPFQNPKIVTCFGRSHSLQKKVDELLFMIHYHNKEKVEEIMEEETKENQAKLFVLTNEEGLPCLIKAVERQSLDCAKPLFERFEKLLPVFDEIGINKFDAIKSKDKKSLFHFGAEFATHRAIIDALKLCPLKEEIAHMKDCNDSTPLIVACERKNYEMAAFLVSCKAKIDHVDKQGNSPIYLAAMNGCSEILKILLDRGFRDSIDHWSLLSDNKLYNKKGTILQAIIESKSIDTVRACCDNAELNRLDLIRKCLRVELENDQYFLHKVCRTPLVDLVEMAVQDDEILLNRSDNKGMTPLMWAVEEQQLDVVRLILRYKCGRDSVTKARKEDNRTALMIACMKGYDQIAKLIVEGSVVKLTDLDCNNRNVFHHASKHPKVLKVLIDVCCKREDYSNYKECFQAKDDCGFVPLHLAAASGSHENVELLLKNGTPYNIKSSRIGRLPLHYAACKTLPTVKALVEYVEDKYDVKVMQDFIDSVDYKAFTSMHLAASFGKWRTVSYLLEKGATLKCNYEMETPLHFAATSGCTKTVECLLKNNRSVITLENVVGETAAMFAAVEGHTKVLQHLFKYDVQLWSSSTSFKKQKTCLDWAVLCKKSDTAAAILDYGDWKETMKRSSKGADGLLADMVKNMSNVALKVLEKCVTEQPNGGKEYDFFPLQTVKEVTTRGRTKKRLVAMQAIENMVKFSRDECLRHDVVQTFLHRKWVSRIRKWWLFGLFLYLVFLISLTTYIGLVRKDEYSAEKLRVVITVGICIGFASLSVIMEFFQLWHKKLNYFLDFTTCVELVMYISVFIFLPNDEKSNLQWQAGAIAVFLGWINFIWFLKRFPAYGIYIIMVKKIFVTFLKVFVPLGFFIMAFAMTFFVLMPRDAGFKTIPLALVTSFAMMVGEVDYRDTFIDEQNRPKNFALIIVFVVISLIVMTILLMNLLTGLAVGDTGEILKRSMAEKRIQQVDFNHPKFIM